MQKVNTFNASFDARKTSNGHAAHAAWLGRAIGHVWARLLEASASEDVVEATRQTDDSEAALKGPGIPMNHYDGAHERVKAGTDRAREVALTKDTVLIALSIL